MNLCWRVKTVMGWRGILVMGWQVKREMGRKGKRSVDWSKDDEWVTTGRLVAMGKVGNDQSCIKIEQLFHIWYCTGSFCVWQQPILDRFPEKVNQHSSVIIPGLCRGVPLGRASGCLILVLSPIVSPFSENVLYWNFASKSCWVEQLTLNPTPI